VANDHGWRGTVSTKVAFLTLAGTRAKQAFAVPAMLLVAYTCWAQDQTQAPPDTGANSPATVRAAETVTIPAGTRFSLVLTTGVSSKTLHRGDEIYAQTIAPIAVGDRVVIPAGTFLQGKLDKLARNGTRAQMKLQSVSIMFPDGFVASANGPLNMESDEGTAWRVPGGGNVAGAIAAPLAGFGLGTLIGHEAGGNGTNINGMTYNPGGLKSTAIGGIVGLAAGGAVSFIFLTHSRHFVVDVGSPMEMTLPQAMTLAEGNVGDAVRDAHGDATGGGEASAAGGAVTDGHGHVLYAGNTGDSTHHHSGDSSDRGHPRHAGRGPRDSGDSGILVSVSVMGALEPSAASAP